MTAWLTFAAGLLLASLGGALWRVWRGPSRADRMMAAQLAGTGGVGVVVLLGAANDWAMIDVALVLALLAAFAAVAFVKSQSPDGLGDPEEAPAFGDTAAFGDPAAFGDAPASDAPPAYDDPPAGESR